MLSKERPEGFVGDQCAARPHRDITLDQGGRMAMLSIQGRRADTAGADFTRRSLNALQLERGSPCHAIHESRSTLEPWHNRYLTRSAYKG